MRKTRLPVFAVPLLLLTALSFSRIEALGRGDPSVGILLHGAETVSQKIKDPAERDMALSPLAAAFARNGDFTTARKIVSRMPVEIRPVSVMPLIQYQVKAGDIAGARNTAALLRSTSSEQWALWVLAREFANAHRWKLAEEVAVGLTETQWRSMALRDIAEMKARSGDLVGALAMVDRPPYGSHRVAIYVAVAHSQYQSHRAGEARATLKKSTAAAAAMPEDWGRTAGFLFVAEAYRKIRERASARAVLEQALAARLRMPGPFDRQMALSDIAEEFAKIGDIDRAVLLAKSERGGRDRDLVYRSIAPAAVAKDSLRAQKIALLIGDRTKRHSTLRAVAMVQASRGLFADSRRTCALIVNDPRLSERTRAGIATAEARAGRPDDALLLIRSIRDRFLRAEPLAAACRSLARSGKMRRAYQEVSRAKTTKEHIQALIGVTEGMMDRDGYSVVTPMIEP